MESLPLRQLTATCEKPSKTGHFSSYRIRTVENHGGDPGWGPWLSQVAIIRLSAEAKSLENKGSEPRL